MDKYSYISNAELASIDELYQRYLKEDSAVDEGWRKFFEGFEFARKDFETNGEIPESVSKEFKVLNLIHQYRTRGHLFTRTNPVRERRKYSPTLALENFGLSEDDLDTVFQAASEVSMEPSSLREIIETLEKTYCESIGVEYMYIRTPARLAWLKKQLDKNHNTPNFSTKLRRYIFTKLNHAVVFESFLHSKYVGQKRFSLEGAESLIPAIGAAIETGANLGIEQYVIGMAHRGRLNVLANILNKTYQEIFTEFENKEYEDAVFNGDVKYHQGYSSDIITDSGKKVHLSLAPNPSHLEAVGAVVLGVSKARLDRDHDNDHNKVAPILIHGDASIAGQGIVYELIQMAELEAYGTGGTIHIVVNNQIGFTTNYYDGRSSTYCTDVAKVTLSPVFHVNGDDVEAVVYATRMAVEFRQEFHKDVFIDLLCYRKYGHSEGDEPRFTQPILYKKIAKHPNPREIYMSKLSKEGVVGKELANEMEVRFKRLLENRLSEAKQESNAKVTSFMEDKWKGIRKSNEDDFRKSPETGVPKKELMKVAKALYTVPKGKKFFRKMEKVFHDRQNMIEKTDQLDWGMCELLAYGTLISEDCSVRFSGQDVERGTFSHRHAVVKLEDSEEEYIALNHIKKDQKAKLDIYNSLLSEYAVLGFEYGYAMASPSVLTIWEAQFGDFSNGAQIIIDQFISSSEGKWKTMTGLVMLLPHGYEGNGAEHSSARIERFLGLCGDNNIQVVNCSTPANFFHVLRRQLHRDIRKPLIVCTPKSLLRHPQCVSSVSELTKGCFREIIDDDKVKADKVRKVVFCSGKIYYELLEKRQEEKKNDIAIVRLEQMYPFPEEQMDKVIAKYKNAKEIMWAQEEPENMGPWGYILRTYRKVNFTLSARSLSSSPASGSRKRFVKRQSAVIDRALK